MRISRYNTSVIDPLTTPAEYVRVDLLQLTKLHVKEDHGPLGFARGRRRLLLLCLGLVLGLACLAFQIPVGKVFLTQLLTIGILLPPCGLLLRAAVWIEGVMLRYGCIIIKSLATTITNLLLWGSFFCHIYK